MLATMHNYRRWITFDYYLEEELPDILESLLLQSGFKILNYTKHRFQPHGCTALWLLSESHLAIHTFPERNKAYIELSSCVKQPYSKFLINFYSIFS